MKHLRPKEEIKLNEGFIIDVITIWRDFSAGIQSIINVEIDH